MLPRVNNPTQGLRITLNNISWSLTPSSKSDRFKTMIHSKTNARRGWPGVFVLFGSNLRCLPVSVPTPTPNQELSLQKDPTALLKYSEPERFTFMHESCSMASLSTLITLLRLPGFGRAGHGYDGLRRGGGYDLQNIVWCKSQQNNPTIYAQWLIIACPINYIGI